MNVRNIAILFCALFSVSLTSLAQTKNIRGVVTDSSGEPLIGASVIEVGTSNGTVSDLSGSFSLSVAEGRTLNVSSLGFAACEFVVTEQNDYKIVLETDVELLEKVVVVGYGVQKKETLTGSVAQIRSDEIVTTKSTSLVSSIQGKVPGVQIRQQTAEPGKYDSMVSIRGFGAPLIVIDGVARGSVSDFERLSPDDIESISVLKDASAAIYGMNADNGVIIVTTKKGREGKTRFNYNGYFGVKNPTSMRESVDAFTYRYIKNEMDRNIGNNPTYSIAELEKWRLGTEPGYQDNNWQELCLKDFTTQQQHSLSASGGTKKNRFYVSLGYMEDNGLLVSDIQKYQKYNARFNFTAELTRNLTAEVTFSGKYDHNRSPRIGYIWVFKPIILADRGIGPTTLDNPDHYSVLPFTSNNPMALMDEDVDGYNKWSNTQFQTTLKLIYDFPGVKGLKAQILGAFDGNVNIKSTLQKGYYLYDYKKGKEVKDPQLATYNSNQTFFTRKDFQAQLLYNNSFQEHTLGATLVWEAKRTDENYIGGKRQYDNLFTNDILNQGSQTNLTNNGYRKEQAFLSMLGRFNYDYKNRYLLEFAFRYDGSYKYAPGKRWAFFPSLSGGWRISEEDFIKENLSNISNLKLRASYGWMGADAGEPFQYYPGYTLSGVDGGYVFSDGVLTSGLIAPGVINNNLSWIKTRTANIGVDLGLWGDLVSTSIDIFQKNRDGLLATKSAAVPNTFGASWPQENLNSDLVRGVEMVISHNNRINDFSYGISANVVYSRRKLLHTERAEYRSSMQRWKDVWGSDRYLGREWGYDYNGQYTDITEYQTAPLMGGTNGNSKMLPGSLKITDANGDGMIDDKDQLPIFWAGQYEGSATNPPLHYGLSFDASWKGFDFNMLLQGSALFTVITKIDGGWGYGKNPTLWEKYLDRWHTADPEADPYDPSTEWVAGKWPALRSNWTGTKDTFVTDMWRLDASYLRIKSVELGYTVPHILSSKWSINDLRVYINAFNLFTFCGEDVKDLDPEREEGEYSADLTYPLMKSFNFGVNIKF